MKNKNPKNKDSQDTEPTGMSFWEHLEELRNHLIKSFIAIVLMAIVAFIFKDYIFDYIILAPKETYFITNKLFCQLADYLNTPALCINQKPVQIINIELAGQFKTHILVSLIVGLIAAFPFVLAQFWSFIRPALHEKERANSRGAVIVTSFLFLLGVSFSYFIIVPLAVNFLGSYQVSEMVTNQIALKSYINTITMVTFATGIVFELPVIVYFLSKVGLVTPAFMKRNRKIAIILIILLAAIITPPDIFSQVLVGIPLYGLYEISIGISRRVEKKQDLR